MLIAFHNYKQIDVQLFWEARVFDENVRFSRYTVFITIYN